MVGEFVVPGSKEDAAHRGPNSYSSRKGRSLTKPGLYIYLSNFFPSANYTSLALDESLPLLLFLQALTDSPTMCRHMLHMFDLIF